MTRVLFFGRPADRLGSETQIDLPAGGLTVGEVRALLAARDPAAAEALQRSDVHAALNVRMVGDDAMVLPDQEIAFFSPFSGG